MDGHIGCCFCIDMGSSLVVFLFLVTTNRDWTLWSGIDCWGEQCSCCKFDWCGHGFGKKDTLCDFIFLEHDSLTFDWCNSRKVANGGLGKRYSFQNLVLHEVDSKNSSHLFSRKVLVSMNWNSIEICANNTAFELLVSL